MTRLFASPTLFLTLALATPAMAQVVPAPRAAQVERLLHAGTWDASTGRLLPGAALSSGVGSLPGDGAMHALGGGPSLIFDNGTFNSGIVSFGSVVILMGRSESFAAGGANVITGMTFVYASPLESFDVTVRLHQAVVGPAGSGAKGLAGEGIAIPIKGLAGDPVNVDEETGLPTVAYELDVLLPYPLHLDDGAIRWGIQLHDEFTFVGQTDSNPNVDKNTDGYNANDGARFLVNDGAVIKDASIMVRIFGQQPAFDPAAGFDADLSGRGRVQGRIDAADDIDVFRYTGLAGEVMTANVTRRGKNELEPLVELVDLSTGVTLEQGSGEKKVTLKQVELPSDGAYALRVSGVDGSVGDYRATVGVRPSPSAKKPQVPEAPGGVLASFVAKAGTELTAVVRPQQKTDAAVPAPVLRGPLGEVDLSPWLKLKGKNTWQIRRAPVPVFGDYVLEEGAVLGGVDTPLQIKASLRAPRARPQRFDELTASIEGSWVARDFVTPANSFRARYVRGKQGGGSSLVQVSPSISSPGKISRSTKTVQSYKVTPAGLDGLPDALRLQTRISGTVKFIADFGPNGDNVAVNVPAGETSVTDLIEFQDGNPNILRFLASNEVWYREVSELVAPPVVTRETTVGAGDTGGLAALRVVCQDEAAAFVVFKTPAGETVPPVFPVALITPDCRPGSAPEDPDVTLWVDAGSAIDGPGSAYWVAAVDEQGNRSVLAGPILAED